MRRTLLTIALLAAAVPAADAQVQQGRQSRRPTAADSALVQSVFDRLIAVAPKPDVPYAWPPRLILAYEPGVYNATAHSSGTVMITADVLHHIVGQNTDFLALVLGHEIGHHINRHLVRGRLDSTAFDVFNDAVRHFEIESDSVGARLALAAGFSWPGMMRGINDFAVIAQSDEPAFLRLRSSHPSWSDRGTFLNQLRGDASQVQLWENMEAFRTGNYLLMFEQYAAAADAFRRVTREFPDAAEAWANLGYARLMQYFDALDATDLRRMNAGQPMVGAFYRRTRLETRIRGVQPQLWREAVAALEEAIRLDPRLALPRGNLGVAYLVHPEGRSDAALAGQHLAQALQMAEGDPAGVNMGAMLSMYVNMALVDAQLGRFAEAKTRYERARQYTQRSFSGAATPTSLAAALDFNEGSMLARSSDVNDQRNAAMKLENWLGRNPPGSVWWELAYERYAASARAVGMVPQDAANFRRGGVPMRAVFSVPFRDGQRVTLGEQAAPARARLGNPPVSRINGLDLTVSRHVQYGMEMVANRQVIAVLLSGPNAPTVDLRERTLGGGTRTLRIGMSVDELGQAAGDNFIMTRFGATAAPFRYYPDLGIGVMMANGVVTQLLIAQLPQQR